MTDEKTPEYFLKHEKLDIEHFGAIENTLEGQDDTLKKIHETLEYISAKLDAHIDMVEPILEGWNFSKRAAIGLKWVAGVGVTLGTIYLMVKQIFFH